MYRVELTCNSKCDKWKILCSRFPLFQKNEIETTPVREILLSGISQYMWSLMNIQSYVSVVILVQQQSIASIKYCLYRQFSGKETGN